MAVQHQNNPMKLLNELHTTHTTHTHTTHTHTTHTPHTYHTHTCIPHMRARAHANENP